MQRNKKVICLTFLLVLTFIGAVMRTPAVFERVLWFDEADTWRASAAQEGITYSQFIHWTNHFENAPLGFLLARMTMDSTGSTAEWAMRLPALVAGILCIPAIYLLGCILWGANPGIMGHSLGSAAAAMAAFDPNLFDQSQQCRMYSLLMLFLILTMIGTIILVRDPEKSKWHWLALSVALSLCLWSTLLGTLVWIGLTFGVGAFLSWHWFTGRRQSNNLWVISGFTFAFVLACLVTHVGIFRTFYRLQYGAKRGASGPVTDILREIMVAMKDLIDPHQMAAIGVYAIAIVGLIWLGRRAGLGVTIVAGMAITNLLLLIPFRRVQHFMDPRYLTMIQPALWIGLGALAVSWLPARWMETAAASTKTSEGRNHQSSPSIEKTTSNDASELGKNYSAPGGVQRWFWLVLGILVWSYAGYQAWQCWHIERWWQQPEKYLFAQEMIRVRDQMKQGEGAIVNPPVADILARYYRLPIDSTLHQSLHERYHTRINPQAPADYVAPVTWVVVGMVNDQGRLDPGQQRYAGATILAMARHYGLNLESSQINQHLRLQHITTARIDRHGITWRTVGVKDSLD